MTQIEKCLEGGPNLLQVPNCNVVYKPSLMPGSTLIQVNNPIYYKDNSVNMV